jgi:cysteine desulfurase
MATAQIYLDHNGSTPIDASVRAAMTPYLAAAFGNPSSGHWAGVPAREVVETARAQVAALLGCAPTPSWSR